MTNDAKFLTVVRDVYRADPVARRLWWVAALYVPLAVAGIVTARGLGLLTGAAMDGGGLVVPAIWLGAGYGLELVLTWLSDHVRTYFEEAAALRYRMKAAHVLTQAEAEWYEEQQTGDLLTRVQPDTNEAIQLIASYIPRLLMILGQVVLTAVYLLTVQFALAGLFLLSVPVVLALQNVLSKPVERYQFQARESAGQATAQAQDILANRELVRAYGLEPTMLQRFGAYMRLCMGQRVRVEGISGMFSALDVIVTLIPSILLILLGGWFISIGRIDAGAFISFYLLAGGIVNQVSAFGYWLVESRRKAAGARRALTLWSAPLQPLAPPSILPSAPLSNVCPVVGTGLRFMYPGRTEPAVFNVDIRLERGERVALVGGSGGGKSTLLKMIMRLYRPQEGDLRIFGKPIAQWDAAELRRHIAVVSQDTFLFPGTLRDNLFMAVAARHDVDEHDEHMEEKMIEACYKAGLEELVRQHGLMMPISERGANLSGGQRQRVAIARAFLKDAPLLLLDEPTAALDVHTERAITDALEALQRDKTVLWVTHRLTGLQNMTRIMVLDGQIREEGTHTELLARGGVYRTMYEAQHGKEEVQ